MKRLALALAAVVALASTAGAAAKYVTTGAAGGGDGSVGNPWKLSEANASAAAGDVVYLGTGAYATAINPTNGSLTTSRIKFLPLATSGVDTSIVVAGITLYKPGITVQGIKSTAAVTFDGTATTVANYARFDSVSYCVVNGSMQFFGAKNCVAYRDTIRITNGQFSFAAQGGCPMYSDTTYQVGSCAANRGLNCTTDSCTVRECGIYGTDNSGGEIRFLSFKAFTQHTYFEDNRIWWNESAVKTGQAVLWIQNSSYNRFKGNVWKFSASTGIPAHALYVRDSSSANQFLGETFQEVGGTQLFDMDISASGSFVNSTIRDNAMNGCDIRIGQAFMLHDGNGIGWNLFGNLIACRSGAPLSQANATNDSTVICNNTFYNGGGIQNWFEQHDGGLVTNGRVRANLFLSRLPVSSCTSYDEPWRRYQIAQNSDSNVVFVYNSDSTKFVHDIHGGCTAMRAWVLATGDEPHSRIVDPAIHDTTWATLNLRPLPGSPLLLTGSKYVGAYSDTSGAVVAPGPWTITSSAGANGVIIPSGTTTVANGGSQVYVIGGITGYNVADVLVNGGSVGAVPNYTFTNVSFSQTISATFSAASAGATNTTIKQSGPGVGCCLPGGRCVK